MQYGKLASDDLDLERLRQRDAITQSLGTTVMLHTTDVKQFRKDLHKYAHIQLVCSCLTEGSDRAGVAMG